MSLQNLYVHSQPLAEPLTLGLLRQYIQPETPLWISLEPRAWLLERKGRRLSGRLPGLAPLTRTLPEGMDDLPLLAASLFEHNRWRHFLDAQPLSQIPGQCITWSLEPQEGAEIVAGLLCQKQGVLPWQDRQRFGLPQDSALPARLDVEHYYLSGKRLAWRLIPGCTEASA